MLATPISIWPLKVVALAVAWASAPLLAQGELPSFVRVEGAAAHRAALRVAERFGGGQLVADGDRLWRVIGEDRRAVVCTMAAGTGAIRALVPHPDGTTYIAAERGLFSTAPGIEVTDPVDWRDGVPTGEVVGGAVDGHGHLWLATPDALACTRPHDFYGRTWSAEDGLPDPPYRGLAIDGGQLVLVTADATYRYALRRSEAPVVERVELGAQTAANDGAPLLVAAGEIPVVVTSRGSGSLSVRFRRLGHHLYSPLVDSRLPEIDPGHGGYELVVVDRELRRSEPFILRLKRDYPFYYAKVFLLGSVAGVSALVALWFLWRSRRNNIGWWRAALSTGLVIVLGLQVLAAVLRHGRSWPFVGWSMYTETFDHNALVHKKALVGMFADGVRRELHPASDGRAFDGLWQALEPLVHGGRAAAQGWVQRYRDRHPGEQLVGLRVLTKRHRLTSDGPVRVAPLVLAEHYVGEEVGK